MVTGIGALDGFWPVARGIAEGFVPHTANDTTGARKLAQEAIGIIGLCNYSLDTRYNPQPFYYVSIYLLSLSLLEDAKDLCSWGWRKLFVQAEQAEETTKQAEKSDDTSSTENRDLLGSAKKVVILVIKMAAFVLLLSGVNVARAVGLDSRMKTVIPTAVIILMCLSIYEWLCVPPKEVPKPITEAGERVHKITYFRQRVKSGKGKLSHKIFDVRKIEGKTLGLSQREGSEDVLVVEKVGDVYKEKMFGSSTGFSLIQPTEYKKLLGEERLIEPATMYFKHVKDHGYLCCEGELCEEHPISQKEYDSVRNETQFQKGSTLWKVVYLFAGIAELFENSVDLLGSEFESAISFVASLVCPIVLHLAESYNYQARAKSEDVVVDVD